MKILLFTILSCCCCINVKAQITFYGESDTAVNETFRIQLYRPIANTMQQFYADSIDDIPFNKEGRFSKTVVANEAGLYFLGMPNGQKFKIIVTPGDTVHFRLTPIKNGFYPRFTGKRGFANEYVNNFRDNLTAGVNKVHQGKFDENLFWHKIDSLLTASVNFIRQQEPDNYRVNFLINNVEAEVLYVIINLYGNATDKNPDFARYKLISEKAYQKFNPLQEKYLPVSPVSLININKLGHHINQNKTQFAASQFLKADSNWANLNDGFTIPSTLPEPFREAQLGTYILLDALVFKGADSKRAMAYFSYQYSKSAFTNIFLKILLSRELAGEKETVIAQPANAKLLFESNETNLGAALKKYAPNKKVLIDCWATWCIYCVAEFPHYPKYERFFQDNNIVKFFISYDNPKNREAIEKVIAQNKLGGIHLVVNPELKKQISKLVNYPDDQILPLPRYILLDEKHRVIDVDLVRPSNPNFEKHITTMLSTGKK